MSNNDHTTSTPWLVGPARDLALFIATPVLILPIAMLVLHFSSDATFVLLVAAFGQVGHNLPGLIRAYGDRALFDRYKVRFLLAPAMIGVVCLICAFKNLHVLILATVCWAIWHALMQTYGFLRIYSARVENISPTDGASPMKDSKSNIGGSSRWRSSERQLDFAMCVLWFGGAIILNEQPLLLMVNRWYQSGGFGISPDFLSNVQITWWYALITVTAVWSVQTLLLFRRAPQPALIKLTLMISSVGFYWFAYVGCESILVGAALFEIFHDVQYLSIVWLFNARRAERDPHVGRFVGYIFRRSGAMVGLYIGLVFAFGSTRLIEGALPAGNLKHVLTALLATSGLLHFYYDGFIWKLRESSTQESLGIKPTCSFRLSVSGLAHALKWSVLACPVLFLASSEIHFGLNTTTRWLLLSKTFPESADVQMQTAEILEKQARYAEASFCYERAVEIQPDNLDARYHLAQCFRVRDRATNALTQLAEILERDAKNERARFLASRILAENGKPTQAADQLRLLLEDNPDLSEARTNLGVVLSLAGNFDEAIEQFERVLRVDNDANTHFNLACALAKTGRTDRARDHFTEAFRLDPDLRSRQVSNRSN